MNVILQQKSYHTLIGLMHTSPTDGHLILNNLRYITTCPAMVNRVVGGILSKPTYREPSYLKCGENITLHGSLHFDTIIMKYQILTQNVFN